VLGGRRGEVHGAAHVPRHDDIGLRVIQRGKLALTQSVGDVGLQQAVT